MSLLREARLNAKMHGLKVKIGKRNEARGDCFFESAVYNINERDCFEAKLPQSIPIYRGKWCDEICRNDEEGLKSYMISCFGFLKENLIKSFFI